MQQRFPRWSRTGSSQVWIGAIALASIAPFADLSAQASDAPPAAERPGISVGGTVRAAIRERNRVYVAAGKAGFKIVDLALGRVIRSTSLKGASVRRLAIADGRAFALATGDKGNSLHELFLKDGSLTRTRQVGTGNLAGVAVVGRRQVVALGTRVLIFEDGREKPVAELQLKEGVVRGLCRSGAEVLLGRSYPGGLGIADVEKARLKRVIETAAWLEQVVALPGAAFAIGMGKLTRIDLETGKATEIRTTAGPIVAAGSGRVCLQHRDRLLFLTADGKETGRMALPASYRDVEARLIGCDRETALFAAKDRLLVLELPACLAATKR